MTEPHTEMWFVILSLSTIFILSQCLLLHVVDHLHEFLAQLVGLFHC